MGPLIALWLLAVASVYDVLNRREVPSFVAYGVLVVGLLYWFVFSADLFMLSISILILILGYIFYRLGYLGGADVPILAGLYLLLPPFMYSIPTMVILILLSLIFLTFYLILTLPLRKTPFIFDAQDTMTAFLWLIGYGLLAYMTMNMGLQDMAYLIAFVGILSSLFAFFKKTIMDSMVEWIPPSKVTEGDVLAVEYMDPVVVRRRNLSRLLTKDSIPTIMDLNRVPVYTRLPPYIPFLYLSLLMLMVGYLPFLS